MHPIHNWRDILKCAGGHRRMKMNGATPAPNCDWPTKICPVE